MKRKLLTKTKYRGLTLPIFVERDDNGVYIVDCPILEGCFTQGGTIDKALENIREVIDLVLEEKRNLAFVKNYHPVELSLHTITV
jgi:predicted RNase H-like HicB family nuclease